MKYAYDNNIKFVYSFNDRYCLVYLLVFTDGNMLSVVLLKNLENMKTTLNLLENYVLANDAL